MEIHKVNFQEDENVPKKAHDKVPREINVGGQAPPPQGQEHEIREDEQVVA